MDDKLLIESLRERFKIEWEAHDRGGIYAFTQKQIAYNSNKIEGSTLTREHTASLFETGSILGVKDEVYRAKDVEEMTGHFAMFNEVLKTWDEPLSGDLIKKYHHCLKAGVFEDMANGYPIGEYKNRPNIAGDMHTAAPEDVSRLIDELFNDYNKKTNIRVYDIACLHESYERIHPFQDGNGRTGRIIVFKECLKNNLIPVIIQNDHKEQYIRALKLAHEGKIESLADFFMAEQKDYAKELLYFFPEHA